MGSGRSSLLFKTIFGTLVALGIILVLLVGALHTTLATDQSLSAAEAEHVKVLGKGKSSRSVVASPQLDLNSMNKRRVPNGPDPIHNRRAGNSKRPPGKA